MFRNLTPHKIAVFGNDGLVLLELEPEPKENWARVNEEVENLYGVYVDETYSKMATVVVKKYTEANLPEPEYGCYLLVSKMVLDAHPERRDLLCPDTGPDSVVRDEQGHILGVKRLQAAK